MNDHMHHNGKSNIELPNGFVVANDSDHKRAFLLTHQINRFNTSNCMVTNHNAQEYPSTFILPNHRTEGQVDHRFKFDRVLCDVPCSSDAAIRKLPNKWATWGTKES